MSQPESHARTPAELSIAGGNFQFSPDGHWLAYQSSQTGRTEVYVAPFPGPGPSRQISVAGGAKPRWRGDGTEIFFVAPDGRIAAARVSVRGGSVESSEPQMLFSAGGRYTPYQNYHVSFDGQRILAITPRDTAGGLTIIQDWPALLKK